MLKMVLFAIFTLSAIANASYTIMVHGTLISFDQKTVTLEQEAGPKLTVPRTAIPAKQQLVSRSTYLTVFVTPSEFLELNPHLKK